MFQTANFEYHGEEYHDVGYLRLSNSPNHAVLHQRIASLEGAEDALVTGSGMAAISSALMTFLGAGDHLLVQDVVYGGTRQHAGARPAALGHPPHEDRSAGSGVVGRGDDAHHAA